MVDMVTVLIQVVLVVLVVVTVEVLVVVVVVNAEPVDVDLSKHPGAASCPFLLGNKGTLRRCPERVPGPLQNCGYCWLRCARCDTDAAGRGAAEISALEAIIRRISDLGTERAEPLVNSRAMLHMNAASRLLFWFWNILSGSAAAYVVRSSSDSAHVPLQKRRLPHFWAQQPLTSTSPR